VPIQCVSSAPFNLTVDSTGGTWSGVGITNTTTGTFDPGAAGPGSYMISYTTGSACNSTDTVMIYVNSADATITPVGTVCANDPAFNLSAASVGGVWSGPGITSSSAGTFDPSVSGPGTFTVAYALSGACSDIDSANITVGAVITPNTAFDFPDTICVAAGSTLPTFSPAFTSGGNWTFSPVGLALNTGTGAIDPAASTTNTTYYVTYTVPATVCGPAGTTTDTVYIQALSIPVVTFNYTSVCESDSIMTPILPSGFTPGGVWSITGGVTIDDSTGVITVGTGGGAGTYSVTYDVTGIPGMCTASGSFTGSAVINPLPTITISPDQQMFIGDGVTLQATGGTSYYWTPGTFVTCVNSSCDTATAIPEETTTFCAHVTDSNGCIDSLCTKVLVVIPCPSNRDLVVPNAFSPNHDGINDELCLAGWDDCVTNFQITIYDRWGEKVFESSKSEFCWDGFYKGRLLDPAVYVYFIKATYEKAGSSVYDGKTKFDVTKTGNISLLR
jgi:gliding motility-associated-like protein